MIKNKSLENKLYSINELINEKAFDKAVDSTNQLIKEFPESHEAFSIKGAIECYLYKFDEALISFNKSKELKCPIKIFKINIAGYHAKKGNYNYNNGNYDEALDEFMKVTDYSLERAEVAFSNIGNTLLKLERIDEAIKYYKKSLKSLPSYTIALSNLANLYMNIKDFDSALPYAQKCYENESSQPFYLINYGRVLEELGNISDAKKLYYKLLMIDPNNQKTFFVIGNFLLRSNQYKEIISLFNSEIKIIESHSSLLNILGQAYIRIENFDEGIKYFLSGYDKNNMNYEISLNLSNAYKIIGNKKESEKFMKKSEEILKASDE